MEELGQVSRRIARKRIIVAVVGPPLQATVYNIKGFKHFYSQKSSSRLGPGGGDRRGALCTGYPLLIYGIPTCLTMGLSTVHLGSYQELPKELFRG